MEKMRKVLVIILVLLGGVLLFSLVAKPRLFEQPDDGCQANVRICPDGTPVGRSGKNCEFDPCPATNIKTLIINQLDPSSGRVGQKVRIIGENFVEEKYVVGFGVGFIYNVPRIDAKTLEFIVPGGHELCAPGQTNCPKAYPQMRAGIHEVKVIGENTESNSLDFEVL